MDSPSTSSSTFATTSATTSYPLPIITTTTTTDESLDHSPEKNEALALQAKLDGNQCFSQQQYDQARLLYTQAILLCPQECQTLLSICYSNRAACHAALRDWTQTVADCSSAIDHDANNVKARLRRSTAYERLGDFTSALADQQEAAVLSPQDGGIAASVVRLQQLEHARVEKQKEEMLTKLKQLGNGILGKFGMSLDQFAATKDPSTGSYSIAFNQK